MREKSRDPLYTTFLKIFTKKKIFLKSEAPKALYSSHSFIVSALISTEYPIRVSIAKFWCYPSFGVTSRTLYLFCILSTHSLSRSLFPFHVHGHIVVCYLFLIYQSGGTRERAEALGFSTPPHGSER